MAGVSKLKLAVDSGSWDAGLRKATSSLNAFIDDAGGLDKAMQKDAQSLQKFVGMMGNMQTTSNTAKGKVKELTVAFEDLSHKYNNLSAQEKSSPFGKALAQSLDQLKGRIQDGNKELQDIQNQLRGTTSEADTSSTGLQALADKFGLNIGQMAKFATAGAAVTAALKVAKDAFFASESNLDEWNRTVESAQSVYEGFLTSLNTGDISGFLSRIDEIVGSAREAYNELDRLSTQKAINNKKIQTQQSENQRMQTMLRTGRYIAPLDGTPAAKGLKDGDKLTAEQLKNIAKHLEGGMTTLRKYTQDEISQTTKSIEALYKKKATNLGLTIEQFKKGTEDMTEFDKMIAGYKKYQEFENKRSYAQSVVNSGQQNLIDKTDTSILNKKNPYEQYKAWGVFKDDGKTFTKLNELINQRASAQNSLISQYGQAYRGVNRVEKTPTTPKTTTSTETYTPAVGSIDEMQAKVKELNKQFNATADQSVRDNLKAQIDECNKQLDIMRGKVEEVKPVEMQQGISLDTKAGLSAFKQDQQKTINTSAIGSEEYNMAVKLNVDATAMENILPMLSDITAQIPEQSREDFRKFTETFKDTWLDAMNNGLDIPDEAWQKLQDTINEQLAALDIDPIEIDVQTGGIKNLKKDAEQTVDHVAGIATAFNAVGNALNQIEDPGAKVAGYIATAIGQTAAAFGTAQTQAAMMGPWAWIAFAATGLATMISTIQGIKSATAGSYADGGLIKGSSYTGDAVPIMANAGEIVLNYAQQSNIASALESKSAGGGGGRSTISGEQIVTVVNAYGRRTGRGEILR